MSRVLALAGLFLLGSPAVAQEPAKTPGICAVGGDFEALGYRIRDAQIEDPWHFLRALGTTADAADQAVANLKGQPYNYEKLQKIRELIVQERFLPTDISYSVVSLNSCSDQQLDVVFRILSVQISPVLSSTFEFRQREKTEPKDTAGMSKNDEYFRLIPAGGYDHTDRFFAGGTVEARWNAGRLPVNSFYIEGYGSPSLRLATAAFAGQYDSTTSWLGHADWRLDYKNSSVPTGLSPLNQGRLAFQFIGESHPIRGIILRSGVTLEGGNQQSTFSPSELSPDTLPSTGYTSIKIYSGITAHPRNQALSLSYGLQLGSTSSAFHGDWRKQIGDAAYEFWWPISDHRLFEMEQRFTAGATQTLHAIPAPELFFGGNSEDQFIPGDTWQILANPFIRSIPAHRFYSTPNGVGGDQFVSYNLTSAVTVWRRPLVPPDIASDSDFNKKLNGALESSTSILQVAYASDDTHFRAVLSLLSEAAKKLEVLKAAVAAARTGAPPSLQPAFNSCLDALGSSLGYVQHAKADKPVQAYGSVQELLPDGDGALLDTVSACGSGLNATLNDPAIASASTSIRTLASQFQTQFSLIDQNTADRKASEDMSYVRRTLDIILKEMNIASLSPVAAFDVAHLGPTGNNAYSSGTRYGVGGGIRFSLASTANITVGYSWNPNPRPGEGPGALFFSFNTRNLFQ
jgi:hypothetical protein